MEICIKVMTAENHAIKTVEKIDQVVILYRTKFATYNH